MAARTGSGHGVMVRISGTGHLPSNDDAVGRRRLRHGSRFAVTPCFAVREGTAVCAPCEFPLARADGRALRDGRAEVDRDVQPVSQLWPELRTGCVYRRRWP